ncbi:NUDIX hydrolase [Candidatus Woesearchaeota archaeon]|nr:NUDIX hydrolase [Candidatus Woesearchaeota archaeon]MCF7900631.1 NUDIX hydrolase [Candidatus Woesearchaeota archaeon]MCF8013471.1 NUDIX hydrolase [Candidatus Woesearchaeota archaeon]
MDKYDYLLKKAKKEGINNFAAGVILGDTKKIILFERPQNYDKGKLKDLVGGKLKKGESILEGITRESLKEIGVIPQINNYLGHYDFLKYNSLFRYFVFLGDLGNIHLTDKVLKKHLSLGHEHKKYVKIKPALVSRYNIRYPIKKMIYENLVN